MLLPRGAGRQGGRDPRRLVNKRQSQFKYWARLEGPGLILILGYAITRERYNPEFSRDGKRGRYLKMKKIIALAVVMLCALSVQFGTAIPRAEGDAATAAMESIRPEGIRAGMRFLSDDLLEGRGTGTRGYNIAAKYVAAEFEGMGLQAAGDNGTYFQSMPLRTARINEAKTTLTLGRAGKEEALVFRKDFIADGDANRADTSVEAPVVYVGTGVTAPEQGYDDYKGIDVKGKIVAVLFGAPPAFGSSLRAHYSSDPIKAENAVAHGAVGFISLADPAHEQLYSFSKQVRDLAFPDMWWLDKKGRPNDYYPELEASASLSMPETRKFFQGSQHSADDVFAAAKAGKAMSFELPFIAKIQNVTTLGNIQSMNVAAKIPGSDPALAGESVVFTAHLDHLGIGEPVKGDKIYNGALDNASGSAILLEIARAFAGMSPRPRRSMVFVAVTGEEADLLGSDYFAHFPTVEKKGVVANVNMDEDLMLWPLRDIVAYGAEHSSLEKVVNEAAGRLNLTTSPDPAPEEVNFIRSDQYSFVRQGVPAVFPVAGFKSDDPKIDPKAIFKEWEETRYHQPQDDMNQPGLDFNAAATYARFIYLCGWEIAQKTERPAWNPGDFFGEHYAGKSH
jgi:hypothetical protein